MLDNTRFESEATFVPFYFLGIVLALHIPLLEVMKHYKNIFLNLCLVLYPLSMIFFRYPNVNRVAMVRQLFGEGSSRQVYYIALVVYTLYCKYVVPILGTGFLYRIISGTIAQSGIYNVVAMLGQYTMQIYLLHGFLYFTFMEGSFVNAAVSLVTCIAGSVLISALLKRYLPYVHGILFGR